MKPRKLRLNDLQQQWVKDWWRALQPRGENDPPLPGDLLGLKRADRAQISRCTDVPDLLAQRAVLIFAQHLIERGGKNSFLPDEGGSYEQLARVAALLALVREPLHEDRTLAWQLGHAAGNPRPLMSELRFMAMQRCWELDELLLHWRRALQLADRKANLVRLADDLLLWQKEQGHVLAHASAGVKFRWAHDYYLSSRDQAAVRETESMTEKLA